ncbi:MAG: hypothetical protein ACFFDW_01295, partial [Candidatus Thorarchaeota archaeon]
LTCRLISRFQLTLILGSGVEINGKKYYYNKNGEAISLEQIRKLSEKKVAIGSCAALLKKDVDIFIPGCMPQPILPILKIFKLLRIPNRNFNPFRNKYILTFIFTALKRYITRRRLIRKGFWLDCPQNNDDRIFEPEISKENETLNFYEDPYPKMTSNVKSQFLKNEKLFF